MLTAVATLASVRDEVECGLSLSSLFNLRRKCGITRGYQDVP